jgi:hypothetical protein
MIERRIRLELSLQHLHSADAYYKNVVLADRILVIPYVNLGFWDASMNSVVYIDYCHIVVQGITRLSLYKLDSVLDVHEDSEYHVFLGGLNLDGDEFVDMDIQYSSGWIYLPEDAQRSTSMWVPVPTPNMAMNLDEARVRRHFSANCAFVEKRIGV